MSRGLDKQGAAGAARRRRRLTAVAASLSANALLLALLAWTTPGLRLPPPVLTTDMTLVLVHLQPTETKRSETPTVAPRPAAAAPAVATTQAIQRRPAPPPLPTPLRTPAPSPRPAPPAPAAPPLPAPGPPAPSPRPGAGAGQAPSAPSQPPGDVRGAVRAAIGCEHEDYLRLDAAERAACDRKMAEARPKGAYIDPIPPLKRGAFDRQAAADARRRDHEGPMSNPIVSCSGPGSNLGGGCLPPEAMHNFRVGPTPRAPTPDPDL